MRKANKRLAIAILAVLLVVCFCTGALLVQRKFADAAGVKEQEAVFVEDQVLVTLTKEETRKFLDYSAEDFQEIGAKSVEDLTAATAIVSFYFGGWEQMMQAFAEYWQTFMDGGVPATE